MTRPATGNGNLAVILLKYEQLWAVVDEDKKVLVIDGDRQVFKKRRAAHEMLDYLSPKIDRERAFDYQP